MGFSFVAGDASFRLGVLTRLLQKAIVIDHEVHLIFKVGFSFVAGDVSFKSGVLMQLLQKAIVIDCKFHSIFRNVFSFVARDAGFISDGSYRTLCYSSRSSFDFQNGFQLCFKICKL